VYACHPEIEALLLNCEEAEKGPRQYHDFQHISALRQKYEIKGREPNMRILLACGVITALMTVSWPAYAFQLAPVGTKHEVQDSNISSSRVWIESKLLIAGGVELFVDPVHETLTQMMFSCDYDWAQCANADLELAGPYVIAGVRWNDDPGFRLAGAEGKGAGCIQDSITFMRQTCWIKLFKDGEKRSLTEPAEFMGPGRKSNLMTRSHFGDLQFLHAMASGDGVTAAETKEKIMMWSRFAWGVVMAEYGLGTDLGKISMDGGWEKHFVSGPNVQDLLTTGRSSVRQYVDQVAFGSLLHMVQDSFSGSHVQRREPVTGQRCANGDHRQLGRIESFSSYVKQNHETHGTHDTAEMARSHRSFDPDVVDAGRILVDMFKRKVPWAEVSQYLSDCVFVLENPAALSGPGVAAN
jgi:hypothetical protein